MASQTYQYAGQLIKPTCDEDWVPFEPIIKELYKSMTLKDLMVSMKFQYAFQATLDQYKHRLAKWNVDNKRIKGDEYRAMLKKTKLRSLEDPPKQTEFWLHGQRVNPDNIARFEKRAKAQGKISDEDTFSDISTPRSLTYCTPERSPLVNHLSPGQPSRVSPSPSNRSFEWWDAYANYRIPLPQLLKEGPSLFQRMLSQRTQILSSIDDLGRLEVFQNFASPKEFVVELMQGICGLLDNIEKQTEYDKIARQHDNEHCPTCWLYRVSDSIERCLAANIFTPAEFLRAAIYDLIIVERAGPLLDPVGFLPMLTELVRNLGLWELVILIAPASSYWIKVIPTDDDDAKCIGDIGIYLLEALIRLGEINEASMILSSTILQYYSHISIYTTYLPCIHLLRAIQKHRDVFWNITLMLSSEEEILTQDYRWLDDVWNCELRFTYAWIVYQVQRSSDVMIALTKDDVTCVCIDDTVKDGYRMIGDVLDEEQEDEEAEDGDGDAIMLVV